MAMYLFIKGSVHHLQKLAGVKTLPIYRLNFSENRINFANFFNKIAEICQLFVVSGIFCINPLGSRNLLNFKGLQGNGPF